MRNQFGKEFKIYSNKMTEEKWRVDIRAKNNKKMRTMTESVIARYYTVISKI